MPDMTADTIIDQLAMQAEQFPDRLFLRWLERDYSYRDFLIRVRRTVWKLQQQNVTPDSRVGIYVDNYFDHLLAYFATMAIGAIPVHLWPQRPVSLVNYACEHVSAELLVSNKGVLPNEVGCRIIDLGDAEELTPEAWSERRSVVAYIMFTSGTTSKPKAVMNSHGNVDFVTRTLLAMAEMRTDDHELIYMPLYSTGGLGHIHGLIYRAASAHLLPLDMTAITDEQLIQVLDVVAQEQISGFLTTISVLDRLRSSHRVAFRSKAANMRFIAVNVAPLPEELVTDLLSLLPNTRIHHYYGATEASRSAYQCYNDNPGRYASAGKAATGVTIQIDEPNADGLGQVIVTGGQVMLGYWQGAIPQNNTDIQEYRTGDIGVLDKAGFLTIQGRVKDNISVDGIKFLPREVEAVLRSHPNVADCAVVALPDPRTYQRPGAAVVLAEGVDLQQTAAELRAYCLQQLEAYKVPQRFAFPDKLPRGELGKVIRSGLIQVIQTNGIYITD